MMLSKILKRFCTNKTPIPSIKSDILHKAEEVTLSEEQMQEQVDLRLKELEKKYAQTQALIDTKIKFPIKLCGTNDRYEDRYSYLAQRIMGYYRIPKSRLNEYLLKMFKASLYAMADRNTDYMNEYFEEGLKVKVLEAIDNARNSNFSIKVSQDPNYLDEIPESIDIVDSIMLRGLSMDRSINENPKNYVRFTEADEVGLITYTPKQITENNENFIDPKKNKNVYDGYDRMLLRVLVRIKSPLRLTIPELEVPSEIYTWEHLCIMENQMAPAKPLESGYKIETYLEWLGKYRFGPWKIVDIDNYMKGNSPFANHYTHEEIDPIFKGTKFDKSSNIDIRMI